MIVDRKEFLEALKEWRDTEPGSVTIPLEWLTGEHSVKGAHCFSNKHFEMITVRSIDELANLDFIAMKRAKLQKQLADLEGK